MASRSTSSITPPMLLVMHLIVGQAEPAKHAFKDSGP
jgi:hypothetical protein